MPRIPKGLVDRENATLVEPSELVIDVEAIVVSEAPAPQLPAVVTPADAPEEGEPYVFKPDGYIDNVAMTARWLKESAEILGEKPDPADATICAGLFIFAGQCLRFDPKDIAHFTSLSEQACKGFAFNLRRAKLVQNGELVGDLIEETQKPSHPDNEMDLMITFTLYCLTAEGSAKPVWSESGETRWFHTNDDPVIRRGTIK